MIETQPLIIANWKLYKTQAEIKDWLSEFTDLLDHRSTDFRDCNTEHT